MHANQTDSVHAITVRAVVCFCFMCATCCCDLFEKTIQNLEDMTEPNVSYKGLEDCPSSFLVQNTGLQQMVLAVLILSTFSLVDAVPTTTASMDHKDVNLPRIMHTSRSIMMNDNSMPADDIQDFKSSSYFDYTNDDDSLPMTVEVEGGDDEFCSGDEYLDHLVNECRNCTTCGPGMQHEIDQRCGYGNGFEQICEACPDGYYQGRSSSSLVRCQRCVTCDVLAETLRECSPLHDAQCGPCPTGMHYNVGFPNMCLPCEAGGSNKEECLTTKPTTPASTTNSTPLPSPTLTTHAAPVEILITYATIVTPSNQTQSPTTNATEQTTHGGKDWDGEVVTVFAVVVPLSILALVLFRFLKPRRRKGEEDNTSKKDAENGSNCGNFGVTSGQVRFIATTETLLLGNSPISQQDPSQDGDDLSLLSCPQPLQSDLPFDRPVMFVASSRNEQEPVGQDQGL